ncbi:MAG: tyrosine-protein phosphatase [Chloroflexi bacterium]|nr:tyrosine-protein phosphatase [Chloroflexota bacterium]
MNEDELGAQYGEGRRTHRLHWDGCLNARDLGGYPTTDGSETRVGAIVRTDDLWQLTAAGHAAVVGYGVRSIVDLRTPQEVAQCPNPFARPGPHGIVYVNVSFIDPAAAPPPDVATLADDYIRMLDRFRLSVAAATGAIAHGPDGTVVVHCVAGQDRTGLISALLLDLAGVQREVIAHDYALSAKYRRPRIADWLENGPGKRAERERQVERYAPRPEVMHEVLVHLDRHYGGSEAYLREAGIAPADLTRLRDRLVAPPPRPG